MIADGVCIHHGQKTPTRGGNNVRKASLLPALKTLATLALAYAALLPLTAAAQQPCTAIANDAERLACYDRALRAAPAPAPTARPAVAAAPAAPTSSVATEDRASRRERKARESAAPVTPAAASAVSAAPAAVDPIAPAPAPAPRAAAAAPAAPPTAEATRTRRTASTKEAAPAILPVVIVEIRAQPGRAATFISDKGDAWVQTDNQHSAYPQTPFKASIEPGAMSSFFLVPTDHGRAIRVRAQ